MKLVVIALFLSLAFTRVCDGQTLSEDSTDDVPAEVMSRAVDKILRYYFKPARRPREVIIADTRIKRGWLPKISGVRFVVVTEDEAAAYEDGAFTFLDARREGDIGIILFGKFNPGWGGIGDTWRFRGRGRKLRAWRTSDEWGSGGRDYGDAPPQKP